MFLSKRLFGFAVVSALVGAGCHGSEKGSTSATAGFSASSSAVNSAILLTASSDTPENAGYFATDMQSMNQVLSDPTGNWNFKTYGAQEATAETMASNIAGAAASVSSDGTLLVFITAHGAQNGEIAGDGSAYANFGYPEILQAIANGRQNKPFRRLVLFVSACYSGTWMSTLQSNGGLFAEQLVITSVGPNELSNIGQATQAMLGAFQTYAHSPGITMQQFLQTVQQADPSIQYQASSAELYNEPLINSTTPVAATASPTPVASPAATTPVAGSPASGGSGPTSSSDLSLRATTVTDTQGKVHLYLYASAQVDTLEVQAADQQWYPMTSSFPAQTGWPMIQGLVVGTAWATATSVPVRATTGGVAQTISATISH